MTTEDDLVAKFKKRYFIPSKRTDCWAWLGARDKDGYGRFWANGLTVIAHRMSYELFIGTIPSGLFCCHECNNTSCVNPFHLYVGTHLQNMKDRRSLRNYQLRRNSHGYGQKTKFVK